MAHTRPSQQAGNTGTGGSAAYNSHTGSGEFLLSFGFNPRKQDLPRITVLECHSGIYYRCECRQVLFLFSRVGHSDGVLGQQRCDLLPSNNNRSSLQIREILLRRRRNSSLLPRFSQPSPLPTVPNFLLPLASTAWKESRLRTSRSR